jgi:transposase-like protein
VRVCTAYRIDPKTYYYWKRKFGYTKSPRRVFTEEERLQIVNDAIRVGITRVSKKHQLRRGTIHRWARALGLEIPNRRRRFSAQQKRAIVQEASDHKYLRICDLCEELALISKAQTYKVAQILQLVPIQGVVPPVRCFGGLEDLNAQGLAWMEEANSYVHATTGRIPRQLLPKRGCWDQMRGKVEAKQENL